MQSFPAPPALLADLPRGVRGKALDQSTGYDARFMDTADFRDAFGLAQLGYDPHAGRGLLLGTFAGQPVGVVDDRHITTVAGSRSGKGVSVIIPNLLLYRGSVLVLDPKGENATITAAQRLRLGQTVRILDPFDVVSARLAAQKAQYNPLAALAPASPSLVSDVGLIADAFVVRSGGQEAHWDDTAYALIEGILLHVCTWSDYQDCRDVVTFRRLLTHGATYATDDGQLWSGMTGLYRQMEANHAVRGLVQAAAFDMLDRSENEASGVLSTARRQTKVLDLPELQDILQGNDVALPDLKRSLFSLYICIPASHLTLCARLMRLIVLQALAAMERTPTPFGMLPVRFMLDEMAVLGHLKPLEDAIGQMAGFGVQIHGILQDLSQLQQLYQGRWESFLGNSGVVQFFGNADLTTLKWIAERLGKTTIETLHHHERATMQIHQGLSGEDRRREVVELLTPEEIARFFARSDTYRRCLVIQPDTRPLILSRYHYGTDALFRGLYAEA